MKVIYEPILVLNKNFIHRKICKVNYHYLKLLSVKLFEDVLDRCTEFYDVTILNICPGHPHKVL